MKSKAGIVLAAILVAPAVAALAAIVSAQKSDVPTDVRGEMLTCPNGAQVQSRFVLEGDAWEVTGILQAGLTGTITVSGPTGDVSVTPTVNLVVTGDPQLGQPVTMDGTLAMTGEMVATSILNACAAAPTDDPFPTPGGDDPAGQPVLDQDDAEGDDEGEKVCNRGAGHAGNLLMHVNNGGVHIQRGTVTSFDGQSLEVTVPDGSLTVMIAHSTHLNGDPANAVEVKVRGEFDEGGVVIADEVKVLCPNPHGNDVENDDDSKDDANGNEDDEGDDENDDDSEDDEDDAGENDEEGGSKGADD